MAEFLVALADFDRQRAWAELGYSSLFWFLHRELGLSKGAAHYRKVAAELIQKHPEVVAPLRDGRLCLTSIVELAKVLTVGELRRGPASILPPLPARGRRGCGRDPTGRAAAAAGRRDDGRCVTDVPPPAATPEAPLRDIPVVVQPVEPLLRVTPRPRPRSFRSPRTFAGCTSPCRGASSPSSTPRAMPSPTPTRARRTRSSSRPASTSSSPGTASVAASGRSPRRKGRSAAPGRIRAEVKREVWARDGGRCQWPLEGGGICGSTLRLEFDHVVPRGRGGSSEAANLRLLCRFHNQLTARARSTATTSWTGSRGGPARLGTGRRLDASRRRREAAGLTPAGGTSRSPASRRCPGRPRSPWRPAPRRRRRAPAPRPGSGASPGHPG